MKRRIFIRNLAALSCLSIPHLKALAAPNDVSLNVKVFPGAQNLPLWVGLEKMFFASAGLNLNVAFTVNPDDSGLKNLGLIVGFSLGGAMAEGDVSVVVGTA